MSNDEESRSEGWMRVTRTTEVRQAGGRCCGCWGGGTGSDDKQQDCYNQSCVSNRGVGVTQIEGECRSEDEGVREGYGSGDCGGADVCKGRVRARLRKGMRVRL
jgi:hypothetical protein